MTILASILEWINQFAESNFMPHGMCYMWQPYTLWANVLGDSITALTYLAIPSFLIYFIRKRKNIELKGIFLAFAVFIIACGLVHGIQVINVWVPLYNISGTMKLFMAFVSVGTVGLLVKKMPVALKIPSPHELQIVNEELNEKTETLSLAVEAGEIGVWDWRINDGTMKWNDYMYSMFGVKKEEVSNTYTDFIGVLHPEDVEKVEKALETALAGGPKYNIDYRIVRPDGDVRHITAKSTILYNDAGEPEKMIGTCLDITKRKENENKLKESRERFKNVFESPAIGIALVATDGTLILSNDKLCKYLGYSNEELREMSFSEFTHPDFVDADVGLYLELLEGNRVSYSMEKKYITKDGNEVWAELFVSVVRNESGAPQYAISLVQDISEKKQAAIKLKDLNNELERRVARRTEQLEKANSELEAFSYSVSHDLRTPLRAIKGFSEILLEDHVNGEDKELTRLANMISDNASKMSALIDEILEFSRLGRSKITKSKIDLNGMVQEVFDELKIIEKDRDIILKKSDLPEISGDVSMMRQVIQNLLSNAIKYSGNEEQSNIEVGSFIDKDKTVIYVKDNGVGFNMKYLNKIFGVFQRLHSEKEFEGTGVGMALSKKIIERHGGAIWAESELGEGATFYFSLPNK